MMDSNQTVDNFCSMRDWCGRRKCLLYVCCVDVGFGISAAG